MSYQRPYQKQWHHRPGPPRQQPTPMSWDGNSDECNGCFANATAVKHGYRCCSNCQEHQLGELYNTKLAYCLAATGLDAPPIVTTFLRGSELEPVNEDNLHDIPF